MTAAAGAGRPPGDDIDPRAPLFFLSYAHPAEGKADGRRHEPHRRLLQFFNDLSENVAELVALPAGAEPGYMDRSMSAGTHWTPELLDAVGNCQVFVALLSVRYFRSKWCSMEWHAFSQRNVVRLDKRRTNHQTNIVPVIWAGPIRHGQIPAVIGQAQRFAPGDPEVAIQYDRNGIFGMLQMAHADEYQTVVWQIAQHIADLQHNYWVEPLVLDLDQLCHNWEF